MVENIATSASVSKIDVQAIGIGTPGTIDKKKGIVLKSANIPMFIKYPICKNIEKITGSRVILANDATVALIGSWWKGNMSKYKNWVLITLGTGIGGGAIIDNKIYDGTSGNAMEVGHMTIEYDGKECACGNRGCWERYASASALIELTQTYFNDYKTSTLADAIKNDGLNAEIICREAVNKDELARKAIDEIASYIGIGVANLVSIFNPEAVLIAGGLSNAGKLLIPTIKKVVNERTQPGLGEEIEYLTLKDQAQIPALGAAKIAMDSTNSLK
jgi:glucokinase